MTKEELRKEKFNQIGLVISILIILFFAISGFLFWTEHINKWMR